MDMNDLDPMNQMLAKEILALTRDSLLVSFRFMDVALCELDLVPSTRNLWATDGLCLHYDTRHVLSRFRIDRALISRDFLHLVLHCVFRHPFGSSRVQPDCWDLACDITVENILNELDLQPSVRSIEDEQRPILDSLKKSVRTLTADRIYSYLADSVCPEETVAQWRRIFHRDEHDLWNNHQMTPPDQDQQSAAQSRWKSISERMQVDLDTVSLNWSDKAGSLSRNVWAASRDRDDFGDFLRRFMVLGELLKINDEEFDYVYYHYGLERYGNMPLIEPLEYKEVRRIRDFVIAIDTSGSCSGELVQAFIDRTCALFRQGDNFFQTFNVHIIQCDADIQSDITLTSMEDFAGLKDRIQLRGFGGTDFRPVFRKVDEMIARQIFTNLKGLIYFTDGHGIFPEKKPAYEVAFVFITDDGRDLAVPPWAIRLVLDENDIRSI